MLNILVACEESQAVCKEFRALGHNAFSCDIEPCSGGKPEWHIQGDVLPLLNPKNIGEYCNGFSFKTQDKAFNIVLGEWDLIIAFPPCTYLSNAGAARLYPQKGVLNQERYQKGLHAKEFLWLY